VPDRSRVPRHQRNDRASRSAWGGLIWPLAAALGALGMVWAHAWLVSSNDYGTEAAAALGALLHGHLAGFLTQAPAYGASLELRAPFALVASIAGGGELAVYRASAVPCALACAGLGVWLAGRMARRGVRVFARVCVLAVCVLNPISYEALAFGHPEELLGAVLCVAGVLCAADDRPVWAGLLIGLAIGNKEWALVAVGPMVIAAPSRRMLSLGVCAVTAAALVGPLVLAAPGGLTGTTGALATKTGVTFHPFQIWWFLGQRIHWVPAMAGMIPRGARTTPGWLDGRAHLIVVGVSVPLTLLYHRSRSATRSPLMLLALLLALRCVLDPWDIAYYPLPFLLALASWECLSGRRAAPCRAVAATAVTWFVFVLLPRHVGVDAQSVAFAAVAVPTVGVLVRALYRPADRQQAARADLVQGSAGGLARGAARPA
jgi:glycosyl transferase family 87